MKERSAKKSGIAALPPAATEATPQSAPETQVVDALEGPPIGGPVWVRGMIRQRKLTAEEKVQFGTDGPIAPGFPTCP